MNILYVWAWDYPWDIRVEKICTSLAGRGHNVHLAARNTKGLPLREMNGDLAVHRLRPFRSPRLNNAFSFPAFFNPFWKRHLEQIVVSQSIDLVMVRDLPLAITALGLGARHGLPVIMDMAEDYVELLRDIWRLKGALGPNLLVRNPYFAGAVERWALPRFDHILIVVEEAASVLRRAGTSREKATVVSNTPPRGTCDESAAVLSRPKDFPKDRFTAVFTGKLTANRGLETVIEAIPILREAIPEFLFLIIGEGYTAEGLRDLARRLRVEEHVFWKGWVPHAEMYDYISASSFGIIPHLVSPHIDTTIPNKIFDYMGCGIPVISSDGAPLKRILTEEGCGLTYRGGDSADLAARIIELHRSGAPYGPMGRKAVQDRYNWEEDEKRLFAAIEAFA